MKRTPRLQFPKDDKPETPKPPPVPREQPKVTHYECPFDGSDEDDGLPRKLTEAEEKAGELIGRNFSTVSGITRRMLDEAIEQCGEQLVLECLNETLALPIGRERTFRTAMAKAKTRASRAGFDSAQAEPSQGTEQTVLNMTDEEIERMLEGGHKP